MEETNNDELDFSTESTASDKGSDYVAGSYYDPRPQEDTARRYIAYLLIWLLWVIVLGMFISLWCGTIKISDIKELAVVLGPIVALVSAATGFYYGTKSHSRT